MEQVIIGDDKIRLHIKGRKPRKLRESPRVIMTIFYRYISLAKIFCFNQDIYKLQYKQYGCVIAKLKNTKEQLCDIYNISLS